MWKILVWWLHFYYLMLQTINGQKSVKCYFFMISLLWYNILNRNQFHCDNFTDFCQPSKFRDDPLTEWNFIEKIDFWWFSKCPQGWLIFMNTFLYSFYDHAYSIFFNSIHIFFSKAVINIQNRKKNYIKKSTIKKKYVY